MEITLTAKACALAERIHRNQKRADGVTPYFAHPLAVSALVLKYAGSEEQVAAAFLHDVIAQDPKLFPEISHQSLKKEFSEKTADYVYGFQDPPVPEGGHASLKDEKLAYLNRVRESSSEQVLVFACEELDELADALRLRKFSRTVLTNEEHIRHMNQAWYFKECLSVLNLHVSERGLKRASGEMLRAHFASTLREFQNLVFEGNQTA